MIRAGLFSKILLAFWLTLLALGVTLGLLFGRITSADREGERSATAILMLLQRTIEHDGAEAARREIDRITPTFPDRRAFSIVQTTGDRSVPPPGLTRAAVAQDGATYLLVHRRDPSSGLARVPRQPLWGGLIAGVVFSIGLAAYLSRPLRLVRNGFHRLASGDLAVRLSPRIGRRNDEIADVARDFDVMAERLGQLVTARDRLLHDVSHELRSPLTRLQLAVALARQDPARVATSLERIEREADRLHLLIADLLTLARAEGDAAGEAAYFDPVQVVMDVVEDAAMEAQAKGCRIACTGPGVPEDNRPVVAGDAELFRRAIDNVLRNGIRFSPTGSSIDLATCILPAPCRYRIIVRDTGPGVDEQLLTRLFEPFVGTDRSGTGLGLAIADRAVRAHGGTIDCRNRPAGGLAVTIEVPAKMTPA